MQRDPSQSQSILLNQMKDSLTPAQVVNLASGERHVLLKSHAQLLSTPLGDIHLNVEFHRVAGIVIERIIAQPWDASLLIGQSYVGAGSMAMIP